MQYNPTNRLYGICSTQRRLLGLNIFSVLVPSVLTIHSFVDRFHKAAHNILTGIRDNKTVNVSCRSERIFVGNWGVLKVSLSSVERISYRVATGGLLSMDQWLPFKKSLTMGRRMLAVLIAS